MGGGAMYQSMNEICKWSLYGHNFTTDIYSYSVTGY